MGCPIKTIWIEQVVPLKKIKVVLPEKEVMVTEQETEPSNQTNINKKTQQDIKKNLRYPQTVGKQKYGWEDQRSQLKER